MSSLVRISALGLGFILVFTVMIGPGVLALPFTLAIGWWPAAARLLKVWRTNPGSIVLFSLAVIILVGGSHAFARWLHKRVRTIESNGLPREWSWKWTVCGFGILFCTLLSIASLVLMTHQLFWISKSFDPLFIDPYRGRFVMRDKAVTLQRAAEESHWDAAGIREAFSTEGSVA